LQEKLEDKRPDAIASTLARRCARRLETMNVLKALPDRTLVVTALRASDGQCHALATMPIAGAPAYLFNVYVHIRWYGIDYALLQGWSMDRSRVLREKLKM
jgi:hypothetical protein